MNVLSTTQPAGEQLSVAGAPNFATVAVAGASLSAAQNTGSGLNPGNGLATFTLSGVALQPTASGTYLVTAEAVMNTVLAAVLTLEILLDGVPQIIGANLNTSVVVNVSASFQTQIDWTTLIAAAPNAAHVWSVRVSVGGTTFQPGGAVRLILVELG